MVVPGEARSTAAASASGREKAGGDTEQNDGDHKNKDIDNNDNDSDDNDDGDGDDDDQEPYVPPKAGLRLGVVFNPSRSWHSKRSSSARVVRDGEEKEEESTAASSVERSEEYAGVALPAVLDALRGKSPDKV